MSMANYSAEFDKLYSKAKNYDMILSDGILAYKFLNNASLSSQHQQLVKATLTELTYKNMKEQIRKIFGDLAISACPEKPHIKLEEQSLQTTHMQEEEEAYYGN